MGVLRLPARLWWNHSTYYHRWLLRRLPERAGTALDVGCGSGRLACALARRVAVVDAVDTSAEMVATARQRCPRPARVRWLLGDVLDPGLPLAEDGYDVVTAVSSLHHLPLDAGLSRLAGLVRPGGVLLVVGHHRTATAADRWPGTAALLANAAVGLALAATGRGGESDDESMPVRPPDATLAAVRQVITALPGATITRGLFWRHLIAWRRPLDR